MDNLFLYLTRNKVNPIEESVSSLDASADVLEDLVKYKYNAKNYVKNLSNEELESLLNQVGIRLKYLTAGKKEEEWGNEAIELAVVFAELYKDYQKRNGYIN